MFKKPLIISTGMSLQSEVEFTVNYLKERDVDFILLHCNSTYPAPFHDINLKSMNSLSELHKFVGYSGHERGINVSLAAVALDACVIERHFTLDRSMEGPDHTASLTEVEFSNLTCGVTVYLRRGSHAKSRRVTLKKPGEMKQIANIRHFPRNIEMCKKRNLNLVPL